MDTFNDYYAVLGVNADASADKIKAAFKKLALQYHPDVYKGDDAEERMRLLLLAYQTLSDPQERQAYNAHRSEHVLGVSSPRGYVYSEPARSKKRPADAEVSPRARRDRQRHYAFPDLHDDFPARVDLVDITYDLSPVEAHTLREQGMLRGVAIIAGSLPLYVDVSGLISVRHVRPGIGENTFFCAVFTAVPSLRASRYVTRLVHTTMVTVLSARPTNSSHSVPIVEVQAGVLPKMLV